jgi:hypothetical protein
MDNFYDTAKRMHKSSETLHNNNEFHNACYLAGYVVECYAKIIVGLSYKLTQEELAKEFSHDLKKLNIELQYILSHSQYSAYIVDMNTDFISLISGNLKWNPEKRYVVSSNNWNKSNSDNFQNEIQVAMQKLTQIELDGYNLI